MAHRQANVECLNLSLKLAPFDTKSTPSLQSAPPESQYLVRIFLGSPPSTMARKGKAPAAKAALTRGQEGACSLRAAQERSALRSSTRPRRDRSRSICRLDRVKVISIIISVVIIIISIIIVVVAIMIMISNGLISIFFILVITITIIIIIVTGIIRIIFDVKDNA